MELPALTAHDDRAIGGLLRNVHPFQSLRNLRIEADTAITGLKWYDAAQRLVEPAADTIETVVQAAALGIPMFPGARGAIIQHIQISGIVMRLQQAAEPVAFPRQGRPFRQDGHADQARDEMAVNEKRGGLEVRPRRHIPGARREYLQLTPILQMQLKRKTAFIPYHLKKPFTEWTIRPLKYVHFPIILQT